MATIKSQRGRDLIILNNFKFSFAYLTKNDVEVWRCVNKMCKAKLKIDKNSRSFYNVINEHNHLNANYFVQHRQFLQDDSKSDSLLCNNNSNIMSKRTSKRTIVKNINNVSKRKKIVNFKQSWLNEFVITETINNPSLRPVQLNKLFRYSNARGLICLSCAESNAKNDYANGKRWKSWKINYLKRHVKQKAHLDGIEFLRGLNNQPEILETNDFKIEEFEFEHFGE
ncbi:hypothetical protein O3M35_008491 [Rhynocoris fuscipes]|uniref:FLYWCH-type domain-containing protein n=1 Tax=Rhynocoris fuscipes TaxID=488301 RepID=A0AAW1D9Z5_9HEMI